MEPIFLQRRSKVSRTLRKSSSLRTTVPNTILEFLKLGPGDTLEWIVRIQDGRISVFVRKAESAQAS